MASRPQIDVQRLRLGRQGRGVVALGSRLIHKLRGLWQQDGSPGHRARGLAAGVFTGCLPFFGLQIMLGVALAATIRGNRILAAAGTWISNPLTTLPICWLNYQLGALLIGTGPVWPGQTELDLERLGDLGWAFTIRLLVGSVVMGFIAAAVVGLCCWLWLHHRERHKALKRG
jgi:hypothetical protein